MTEFAAILILLGTILTAIAALGLLRFPDIYTRMHATSKAGPLGAGLVLIGAGIASGDVSVFIRCIAATAFLVLTSPVSAHLLAKSALQAGVVPDQRTSIDEYPRSLK